jgi:hypothetical protein
MGLENQDPKASQKGKENRESKASHGKVENQPM